jgi:hypothetical protein
MMMRISPINFKHFTELCLKLTNIGTSRNKDINNSKTTPSAVKHFTHDWGSISMASLKENPPPSPLQSSPFANGEKA